MTKDLSLPAGAITGDMLDASFKDGLVRVNPNATALGGTVSKEVRGVAYGTSLKLPALKSGGNIHTINARIVAPNGNDRISGHINISLFVNGKALKFNDGYVVKKVEIDIEKKLVGGPSQYYVYVSSVNFSERIETPPRTSGADYVYEMRVVGVHVNDPSYAAQYSLSFSASEPVKSSGGFITDVNWDEVKGKPSLALASQVLTNVPRGAKFTDTNTHRSISDSVGSASTSVSASSKAVKTAYDRGTSALNVANGKLGASSKAVDSDKLDGYNSSQSSLPTSVVVRNGSGDIQTRLFKSEYDVTNPTVNLIMTQVDTASNNYIRPTTPAQFRSAVTDAHYLGKGAKAVDANKLDGLNSTDFARSSQVLTNVPAGAKFTDTNTWRGISDSILTVSGATSASLTAVKKAYDRGTSALNVANTKLGASSKAVDSDKLDGMDSTSFNVVVARFNTSTNSSARLKIRLPFKTSSSKMLKFTVSLYSGYAPEEYEVSGYLYSSPNQWYLPKVFYTGVGTSDIKVGRDDDGYAYVSIGGGSYAGCVVHSVTIGHTGTYADAVNTGWSIKRDNTTPNAVSPTVHTVWHSSNDGSGSGLDADKLDGIHGSQFVRSDTGTISDARLPSTITSSITGNAATATKLAKINTTFGGKYPMVVNVSGVLYSNSKVWFEGSTGQLTAPTFVGSLSGNAASASKWASARTITLAGDVSGAVSIDGASNRTLTVAVKNDSHTHDGRYFTEAEANSRFAYKAHTHAGHDVKTLGHRLSIDSDGKIRSNNSDYRRAGMYGIYVSSRIDHIWSMGKQYQIDAKGANFGNLYGLAYKHTNNKTGGTMAGGHQMVWTTNGTPKAAMGESGLWSAGEIKATGYVRADGGLIQDGHVVLNGSDTWLRTRGSEGWHSSTYGGGIHMTDSTWVRVYNGKSFLSTGTIQGGKLKTKSSADEAQVELYASNNRYSRMFYRGSDTNFGLYMTDAKGKTETRVRWAGNSRSWEFYDLVKAKATNGTISRVLTHDDFLPANPPAGLENTITANWIGAGAINARHLQVTSVVKTGTTYTSFKVAPDAERPLALSKTDSSGNEIEPIFYVDTKGNGYFKGKLSKGTVDIESIQDEARRQINPYYLGTVSGGSQLAPVGNMGSGNTYSIPAITVLGGKVNLSWNLGASKTYRSTSGNPNYKAPVWRVQVYRGNANGALIFDKSYTGTARNVQDREPGMSRFWESEYSIHVEDQFSDKNAMKSQNYTIKVTRVSGTPTSITRRRFAGNSPAFKQMEVGYEYKLLYFAPSGTGWGNIVLSAPYDDYEFLAVAGSDTSGAWMGATLLPTHMIAEDSGIFSTKHFMLQGMGHDSFWRARMLSKHTIQVQDTNSLVYRIWGVKMKEKA